MVKINNKDLERLAYKHYYSIKNYFDQKKTKYTIGEIDNWVSNCFGIDWNFKKLILAKPNELEKLSKTFKWKCCNDFKYFETLYKYLNDYKTIRFFYLNKEDEKVPYRAYELIKFLNINTCPYCNRNTIYNLRYSKNRTSELDHFYPKSKYPFLAISFYNLIPSCKVCNKIKLDNDSKEYINPYDERFDFNKNMKFHLKIRDSSFHYSEDGFKLGCKFDENISNNEKRRIKANIKDFKLYDLYQNHKDVPLELIQKSQIYNETYIDELYHQYEGTLFKNREDLLRLITCGYINDEDIDKRPLSKLIKDISEELELV